MKDSEKQSNEIKSIEKDIESIYTHMAQNFTVSNLYLYRNYKNGKRVRIYNW